MAELIVPKHLAPKVPQANPAKVVFEEVRALKEKIEKMRTQFDGMEVMIKHIRDMLLESKNGV